MRAVIAIFAGVYGGVSLAQAQPAAGDWFSPPSTAIYLTGDSWAQDSATYRLYGVQSCLRGTSFTNNHGVKRDCGEASLAVLIALMRDLRPQCHDVLARQSNAKNVFVFCLAIPDKGVGAGSRIDLGTALISIGYGFAALTPEGKPLHPPYFVAQLVAQKSRAGLWAFPDAPDPNAIILRALAARSSKDLPVQPSGAPSESPPLPNRQFKR